jgi:glycerol-3-phosphate acyltransferase PlsX
VVRKELEQLGQSAESRIHIEHAPDVISMHDSPSTAIRKKPNSSLLRAIDLHKTGKVDAVVSAGHTGVQMAASYLALGLIEGVRRPTIGSLFPLGNGKYSILLDVGANTDCKPIHLLQFAVMGTIYMEIMAGVKKPRVALLSIGEEKTKGNELVLAAHYLLENSGLHFVGNIEGRDILAGKADVLVCDGFVGNLILKFAESLSGIIVNRLTESGVSGAQIGAGVRQLQKEFDYAEIGGVPLLGINGVSIICHGGSSAKAIKSAIREAATLASGDLAGHLSKGIAEFEAGFFARGLARFKGFHEKRDQIDIEDENHD